MLALLQRVIGARVIIAEEGSSRIEESGRIDRGLLIFLCAQPEDTEAVVDRFLQRLLSYRIFADAGGKMNRSVRDVDGGVLLVPQFTLAADTARGLRPGFSAAATPELGRRLFDYAWLRLQQLHRPVACGRFGADMQVTLTNDGPATFWLSSG